jgi:hypothetical protein
MVSKYARRAMAALIPLLLGVATLLPATAAVPIPPGPFDTQVEQFWGAPATAKPFKSFTIPQHPFMSASGTNSMHNDAYATDAYTGPGPLGRDLQVTTATYGIEECATMTFDEKGRIVALCGGAEGSRMMLLDPETLDILTIFPLPPRKPSTTLPTEDLCGGAYFYLDHNGQAIVETTVAQIWVLEVDDSLLGIPLFGLDRTYDLSGVIPQDDCLIALMPDWKGRVWFVTYNGGVGFVNRKSGVVRSVRLPGEKIFNSFSADETGGVFIVSDHAMYRFDVNRKGKPSVTWREKYNRGTRVKPGQLSQGSGATPTLIGRDLVVIYDNADPRMNVLSYRRTADDVKSRLVCKQPVFGKGTSASDNSPAALGRSVIVENNYGYDGPQSVLGGATTTPGVARVGIARRNCGLIWNSAEISPTTVPKLSLQSGLLYLYTKPAGVAEDPFYFTAVDIRTGKTVWRRLTGTFEAYNNHYAPIYLGPDGAAYIATLMGVIRLEDGPLP